MQSLNSLPLWVVYAGVFVVALVTSWLLTPAVSWLSMRWGIVARPGGRRRHQGVIPRLGGLAIYGGFMVAALLTLLYPRPDAADTYRLAGLLLGSTAIVIGGVLDDKYQFGNLPQIIITLIAALIACRYWLFIERVNNPLTGLPIVFAPFLVYILTLLWYSGMTTTVNWLDGLDGLASGVCAIALLVFFVHMLRVGQQSVALLPIALLGAILGFLPRNWYPASIHIGSCGAYFLGYAVGALALIGGARVAAAMLVLWLPILDVAWLILSRTRDGRSPGASDRWHLHFRLLDLGLPHPRIVLAYYALSALLGLLALLLPSPWYKLLVLAIIGFVVTGVLIIVARMSERHASADTERD